MSEQSSKKVTIFISYSWDDKPHEAWVEKLATDLLNAGIDVRLDRWDTDLGDDLTMYMESSVRDSHRVLMICTPPYVRKADGGQGGVGYEKTIITGELARNLGTNKFVPVIRQGTSTILTPTFAASRKYVDFRDDAAYTERLTELINSVQKTTISTKPIVGEIALIQAPSQVDAAATVSKDTPVYPTAMTIIRAEDMLSWRKLVQQKKREFKTKIIEWRAQQDASPPTTKSEYPAHADQMVELASPLISLALAGVESGNTGFSDQRALLDEFLDPHDWPQAGRTALVKMPETLGYVYHCLHGAAALSSGQASLAVELATTRISHRNASRPVFDDMTLNGWSESLGGNCLTSWNFLFSAFPRWPWLEDIFGDEQEYKIALVAYFMVLSFIEYLDSLRKNMSLAQGETSLSIPPCFLNLPDAITRKALRLAAAASPDFIKLTSAWGVSRNHAVVKWPEWVALTNQWGGVRQMIFLNSNPIETFMVEMGWASPVTLKQKV